MPPKLDSIPKHTLNCPGGGHTLTVYGETLTWTWCRVCGEPLTDRSFSLHFTLASPASHRWPHADHAAPGVYPEAGLKRGSTHQMRVGA